MKNYLALTLILAASAMMSANANYYIEDNLGTTFADAAEPTKPILTIQNYIPWMLKDGQWTLCVDSYGGFIPANEADTDRTLSVRQVAPWLAKKIKALGKSVEVNDTVLHHGRIRPGEPEFLDATKLQKLDDIKLPEASISDYVGMWEPIWGTDHNGKFQKSLMPERANRFLLKIRPDMKCVLHDKNFKPDPYSSKAKDGNMVCSFAPFGAGFKDIGRRDRFYWYDKKDELLYIYDSRDLAAFKRTDETFDDPLDRNKAMADAKAYHGTWGVNYEFNIMVISFDRSGKGSMMFFMGGVLFDWKVEGEDIICSFDNETMLLAGGEWKTMICRYDPGENKMAVISLDGDTTPNSLVGKSFDLLTWEVQVDELVKRFEQMKQNPGWKFELERAKNRRKRRAL